MKYIQSKIKFIILSSFIVVFTGCSQSAFKHFDKKDEFVQNVQYTKLVKIVEKNIVKAIATITYLNSADSSTWDNGKQNFIIGMYIIDKNKDCCSLELSIQKKKEIQLNETDIEYEKINLTPVSQKSILKSDRLYDSIPLRNNWAEYKLVSYDLQEIKDIETLTFTFRENKQKQQKDLDQKISFTKE